MANILLQKKKFIGYKIKKINNINCEWCSDKYKPKKIINIFKCGHHFCNLCVNFRKYDYCFLCKLPFVNMEYADIEEKLKNIIS